MQSLAAEGFAVLQMDFRNVGPLSSTTEGPNFVLGLDAAVDVLSERGWVDAHRVGLIGFSRGGYLVKFAVTNPGRTVIAAAIAADSYGAGFFEYLLGSPSDRLERESQYGGSFWSNRAAWLNTTPSFNANRARTPLLLEAYGPWSLLLDGELQRAFQMNSVPVDLLYFPTGMHPLVRPRERFMSYETTIDWMCFWLLGISNETPAKAEQFDRWQQMRSDFDAIRGN